MLKSKHTAEMGFPESRIGTRLLRCAVNYVAEKPPRDDVRVMDDVYPHVAKMFGKRATSVEKSIREVIRAAGYEMTSKNMILLLADRVRDGEFDD